MNKYISINAFHYVLEEKQLYFDAPEIVAHLKKWGYLNEKYEPTSKADGLIDILEDWEHHPDGSTATKKIYLLSEKGQKTLSGVFTIEFSEVSAVY